jgi:hypothetical protein
MTELMWAALRVVLRAGQKAACWERAMVDRRVEQWVEGMVDTKVLLRAALLVGR